MEYDSVEEIIVPDSVRFVENYAFWDCKKLRLVRLPNCELRGESIFSGCVSLKQVLVPEGSQIKFDENLAKFVVEY